MFDRSVFCLLQVTPTNHVTKCVPQAPPKKQYISANDLRQTAKGVKVQKSLDIWLIKYDITILYSVQLYTFEFNSIWNFLWFLILFYI